MTSEVTQAALEPCPFCGDVAYLDAAEVNDLSLEPEDREVVAWSVGCSCCAFHGPHSTEESAIAAWNTRLTAQSGEGQGWIVGNGNGTKWRTWGSTGPEWTEDREQATRYARRSDAERVHAEDEDAWQIVPYSGEGRSGAGEDLGDLEWTEDGYSLCTKYDGDADGDGRHVVVGGDLIVTFDDSEIADEYRERITAALNARQSGEGEREQLREALQKIARRTSITFGRGEMSGREAADIASAALRATDAGDRP